MFDHPDPDSNLMAELRTYENFPAELFYDFKEKKSLYYERTQRHEKFENLSTIEPPALDDLIISNGVYQVGPIFTDFKLT